MSLMVIQFTGPILDRNNGVERSKVLFLGIRDELHRGLESFLKARAHSLENEIRDHAFTRDDKFPERREKMRPSCFRWTFAS
jgi:hypothetical protein